MSSYVHPHFLPQKGKPISLISCTTKEVWKKIYPLDPKEIDTIIQKAEKAFQEWKTTSLYLRSEMLLIIADLLIRHRDEFARIMATEMGKTVREGREEVDYSAGYFRFFAHEAVRFFGVMVPAHKQDKEIRIYYEPVGITALITPWNFPLAMAARKIAPALAAGCSIILKPSPEAPCTLLFLASLLQPLPFPEGLISVVIGDEKKIGEKFTSSFAIRKISFTGSTKVGQLLYEKSAPTIKKLSLELGGLAPLLVFNDADLETAVRETVIAKFRNSGQSCIAANRIFVQKKIFPKFLSAFRQKVKTLKVGNPFLENIDLTSSIHPLSEKKVKKQIADAKKKGAKVHLLGITAAYPTILTHCTSKMLVFQEETFGPLAPIFLFDTEEEAIHLANSTPFGLAAYLFTEDRSQAKRVIQQLEFGIIGLNDGRPSSAEVPFGGVKLSGIGREGGPSAMLEYLTEKLVSEKF